MPKKDNHLPEAFSIICTFLRLSNTHTDWFGLANGLKPKASVNETEKIQIERFMTCAELRMKLDEECVVDIPENKLKACRFQECGKWYALLNMAE